MARVWFVGVPLVGNVGVASCRQVPQMTCRPDMRQYVSNMLKMLGQHLAKNVVPTCQATCGQRHLEDIL